MDENPILHLDQIHFRYENLEVLRGIDLRVAAGETLVVVGPSGGGKTTLLKCIDLLVLPQAGMIRLSGETVYKAAPLNGNRGGLKSLCRALLGLETESIVRTLRVPLHRYRRKFGMVFQEFNLWPTHTIRENIAAPLIWQGSREVAGQANQRVQECAQLVQIEDLLDRYPGEISGGQRQRAAIARALAVRPEVLLLDEITSALDPELVSGILELVEELATAGRTMILVTHHLEFARRIGTRIAYLENGSLIGPFLPPDFFGQNDPVISQFVSHLRRG